MKKRLYAYLVILLLAVLPMKAMAAETKGSLPEASDLLSQIRSQLFEAFEKIDQETGEEIFSFVKEKVSGGNLDTEEGLQKAIAEGEEKFGVELDRADAQRLVDTMEKLENLGFSAEYVVEKAESLYQEYGAGFVDHVDEVVTGAVKDAASKAVSSFWTRLKDSVAGFFNNLFH